MTAYDHHFNQNEWFVLLSLLLSTALMLRLPSRFPRAIAILMVLGSSACGMVLDHTLSVPPYDLYDINDSTNFDWVDFLTYVLYGPIGYLFIYFYDRLKLRGLGIVLYVAFCSGFGVGFEWLAVQAGVFHYEKGYRIEWSFPIYLGIQFAEIALYEFLKAHYRKLSPRVPGRPS